MATPKSFERAGNGHRSSPAMPRMELQDELRAINSEPGAPSAAPRPKAAAEPSPVHAEARPQAKATGEPVVRPVPAAPAQPAVPKPAAKEPVVAHVPETDDDNVDLSEPLRVVLSLPQDEVSPALVKALTFLEDRSLAEIIEAVVRGYFEDRSEDEQVRHVVEAWERYQTV